jgi:hypothetical protein
MSLVEEKVKHILLVKHRKTYHLLHNAEENIVKSQEFDLDNLTNIFDEEN